MLIELHHKIIINPERIESITLTGPTHRYVVTMNSGEYFHITEEDREQIILCLNESNYVPWQGNVV